MKCHHLVIVTDVFDHNWSSRHLCFIAWRFWISSRVVRLIQHLLLASGLSEASSFSPAGPAIVEATSRAATIMAATGPSSPLFFRYYGSDPPWKDEPTNVEVLKGLPKTWITKRVRIFKNEGITTGYYRKKKQSVPKSSNLLKPMQDFKPKIKPLLGKKELLVPEVPTVRTSNIFLQHGNDHDEGWEMEDEIDWFFSDSEDIVTSDRASPLDQNQAMMLKLRLWNHTARNGPKWLIIQFKLSIRLTPEN